MLVFKKLHKNAVIPEYQTAGAACFDLTITEIEYVEENKVIVKYGLASAIPEGFKVVIQPRSSFTHKSWIMANSPAQIDSDYRGEWMSKFEAIPIGVQIWSIDPTPIVTLVYEDFPYKVGERITQGSLEIVNKLVIQEADELPASERGEGGFGSTGK